MSEKIMEVDGQLRQFGYSESKSSPGLYSKVRQRYRIYMDHRRIGWESDEVQIARGPMFNSFVPKESGGYTEGMNAGIIMELRRLVKSGIKFRVSVLADNLIAEQGRSRNCAECLVCGKGLNDFGAICDETCQTIHDIYTKAWITGHGDPRYYSMAE